MVRGLSGRIRRVIGTGLGELVLDGALVLGIVLVGRVSDADAVLSRRPPWAVLGLAVILLLIASTYLGSLWLRGGRKGGGAPRLALSIGASGLYLTAVLSLLLFDLVPLPEQRELRLYPLVLFAIPVLWGLNLGGGREGPKVAGAAWLPFGAMLPMLPVVSYGVGAKTCWPLGVLALLAGSALGLAPVAVKSPGWASPLQSRVSRRFLLPLLAGAALSIWQEMALAGTVRAAANNGLYPGPLFTVAAMTASGVIPVRLAVMLKPPLSALKLVAAAAALTLFGMELCGMALSLFTTSA